ADRSAVRTKSHRKPRGRRHGGRDRGGGDQTWGRLVSALRRYAQLARSAGHSIRGISVAGPAPHERLGLCVLCQVAQRRRGGSGDAERSEEHTSELQSLTNLVCRLLLEKKKQSSTHSTLLSMADIER